MVKDKYGNYVVQKMIEVAEPKMKDNIIKRIEDSNSLKKRDGFSKHVLNFIEKNRSVTGNTHSMQQQNHPQQHNYSNSNSGHQNHQSGHMSGNSGHQSQYYGK